MILLISFLQGINNLTGAKEDIIPRICAKPEKLYYTIKLMRSVTVRFASNFDNESSGAIAGYASYKEGMLFFMLFLC